MLIDSFTLARAIHIVSIVIWMGGVTFVTIILIPILRKSTFAQDQLIIFNQIENQFSRIARVMVILAGLSGVYMVDALSAWDRFLQPSYFWMHAMVIVWLMFFLALFVIEPFFLKNHGRMIKGDQGIVNLRKTQIVHLAILTLSLFTILASVMGAHGFFLKL